MAQRQPGQFQRSLRCAEILLADRAINRLPVASQPFGNLAMAVPQQDKKPDVPRLPLVHVSSVPCGVHGANYTPTRITVGEDAISPSRAQANATRKTPSSVSLLR